MSNRALTWAFAQNVGNAGRKVVLLALADMADEADSCWPSQVTLARMTDLAERSVRRHLAELESSGLISRQHRAADGHRTSDRYVLAVSVAVGLAKPAKLAGSKPARSAGRQPVLPAKNDESTGQIGRQSLKNPQETPTVSQRASRKATRLPDDWLRSDADKQWQAAENIPDEFAREATAEFKDHFKAASGRNATKLDWSAAWKNWMRRAWRERHGEAYRRAHGEPVRVVDFDAARAQAKLERERARFASTDGLASARG